MKVVRLILGVLAGLITITIVTESIEFLIVIIASGESTEELTTNQKLYFAIRNQPIILISKLVYTTGAGIIGGFLTALISKSLPRPAALVLIVVQLVSLIWAGFISDLSSTGPVWMWVALIILVPSGIYYGYTKALKRK